jgi:xylan 1,4-beta-xylosidase
MRVGLVVSILVLCLAASGQDVTLTVDLAKPGPVLNIDHFSLGQGGLSDDSIWGDRIPEVRALHPRLIRLFIQEYFELLPERNRFDWTKLDRAVDTIIAADATPLMNIDFKPRVLFPKVDETITDPTDYVLWEKLISAMIEHYEARHPGVKYYWEIANEPDIGESGGCPYKFTPEGYARYYRHTAQAIRKADPNAKVGGPALANPNSAILPELLRACHKDHLPLDFVSWHIYNDKPADIRATIERKKEQLRPFGTLHPETILDEWNMSLRNSQVDPRFQPAFVAETAWQMFDAGLDYSCYYHVRDYHVKLAQFLPFMSPRGVADMAWWWNRKPQYDGLFDYQNHVRPAYFTFLLLARLTGQRVPVTSSDNRVHGFATWDQSIRKYSLIFWNFSRETVQMHLKISGSPAELTASPEKLDALAPSDDENIRLKPLPVISVAAGETDYPITLEPYDIYFWELGGKSKE